MCGGKDIEETDYEDAPNHVDENGRRCRTCDWEGDVSELHVEDET